MLELWDSSVKHKIKQLGNDRKCFYEVTKKIFLENKHRNRSFLCVYFY